ncbi:protein rep, partial [Staphylococcus hominis]|uniref:protein rep n=1 Tax=Staphylococcus hominis TaxID=1290 RepID=UPI0011A11990
MQNYTHKNQTNQLFKNFIQPHIPHNQIHFLKNSNTFFSFLTHKKFQKNKLYKSNPSNNPFSPLSPSPKPTKHPLPLSLIIQYINQQQHNQFIFFTLTTPNLTHHHLQTQINNYNHPFQNIFKPKKLNPITKPYLTKLHITYNSNPHHYNPHFHLFIPLNKSYFKHTKPYITQKQSLNLSPHLTPISQITQLHLQKINQNTNKQLYQIPKYSPNHTHYLINHKLFHPFYKSLKPKQILLYSPLFKHPTNKLKNPHLHYLKHIHPTQYIYQIFYISNQKQYLPTQIYHLTQQE